MTTWSRHRTSNDTIVAQFAGVTGGTLAGVSAVNGRVRLCSNPTVVSVLPGTIVSSATATVSLALGSWLPTAQLGPWDLTWHPEYTSGARPVWPEDGTDTIVVHA